MEVGQSGEVSEKLTQQDERIEVSPEAKRIRDEIRPMTKGIVNRILMMAKNKYRDGSGDRMAATVACAVMEWLIVSAANRMYKDDPAAGVRFIERVYDAAKQDAVREWGNL